MDNVISLKSFREHKYELEYTKYISSMDKLDLLEEYVRFREEREKMKVLSLHMILKGRILFKALRDNAETQELKILAKSNIEFFDEELKEFSRRNA